MNPILVPESYQYIGVFLTLSCNLSCSYCINHLVGLKQGRRLLDAEEWGRGLSRLNLSNNIPLTLQGGEPSIHKDFYGIINAIPNHLEIDLLTNIQFSVEEFARNIPVNRMNREAPYAPIRVSYHPEVMKLEPTVEKVVHMMELGYKIGLYGVLHPSQEKEIMRAKVVCEKLGIDFRTKEFLGLYEGEIFGHYHYEGAVFSRKLKNCLCKTTELLIDPFGDIFRCHHDLYNKISPIGNLLDPQFQIEDIYRPCSYFGNCNPCDVKLKNNYKQEFGHTSVSIKLL
jgi:MoaA/NifB/PqqE/SkfB family radical SAM enzyme